MNFRRACIPLFGFLMIIVSCQKETSYELSKASAQGSLQSEVDGTCLSKTVNGLFTASTAVTSSNYIEVQVNVTNPGAYFISSDTLNGFYFRGTGNFIAGTNTIKLTGTGTPVAAGTNNFLISFDSSYCYVPVVVLPAGTTEAVFTLQGSGSNCLDAVVSGTYSSGTVLDATNKVDIKVNVTQPGAYTITTTAVNGMTFSASGLFTGTGDQTITLTGSGTPGTAGNSVISISAGTSSCTFAITVTDASLFDYYPRTANSNWSYEFDDNPDDSLLVVATPGTHSALGNTYSIFLQTADVSSGYDSSGYYRKAGNNYYEYIDVGGLIQFDAAQWAEQNFLKDNSPAGTTWTTAAYTGTIASIGTTPITIRIRYTITQKDIAVTVKAVNYPNTIVVQQSLEQLTGTVWTDLSIGLGSIKSYYSRNIGTIKQEQLDAAGTVTTKLELRRYNVF